MSNSTALLVIDVQMGAFDGVRCDAMPGADHMLEKVGQLIDAVRGSSVELIYVQHCAPKGQVYEEGSAHWLFHPDIAPTDSDFILMKRHSSSFEDTELDDKLKSLNIDSIIVCGLQSEHCVSNTALSALSLGYQVTVAHDAHGTFPDAGLSAEQIIERQNRRLLEKGAVIKSSDEVIKEIGIL